VDILRLFFDCDEFCRVFELDPRALRLNDGKRHRHRESTLSTSEVMTIVILLQASGFRDFKTYYTQCVCKQLRDEVPNLVSYQWMVELQSKAVLPLAAFLRTRFAPCIGVSFIDSTPIKVCHNLRIKSNKVFREFAKRGKTSTSWFYGFKVHLVISDRGDLLAAMITPGNVDDRKQVPHFAKRLSGKLFGDRGYISKDLFTQLWEQGLQFITKIKKNMKNKLMPMLDKILLRKRSLIETVNDQLKNICQIEHTCHRSLANFVVNLLAALIAYTYQEKKPSLKLHPNDLAALPVSIF
jgi:hypothetical protein